MGRDLFDSSDAARKVFEQADAILGNAVTALCFEGPEARLQETQHAQPAIFVTSVACLEAARERGVISESAPEFVAGHSLGEYTALHAAGALTFEDGLRLVQERGCLMQEAAGQQAGIMAALLGLEEDAVADICKETGAEICNLNAPGQIVVGGAESAVEAAMALALERGARRSVQLKVGGAFHTSFMEPAAEGM
jgi:[acyl-carrier-protein] S-malonyltransferase